MMDGLVVRLYAKFKGYDLEGASKSLRDLADALERGDEEAAERARQAGAKALKLDLSQDPRKAR